MTLRFARVEQALALPFGVLASPDSDVWHAFGSAVRGSLPEADDLDFKRDWWHRPEELAKDCAALANAGGGVIIVGIDDGGVDIASSLAPFAKPNEFDEFVQQVTASRTAPKLPVVRTRWVVNPTDINTGIAVVAVPRSPSSPHSVAFSKERLGYPIRRSTTTDWMSEAEIADRYRNRFEMARSEQDRAAEMWDAARPALDRTSGVWLAVSLVPSLRGALPLAEDERRAAEDLADRWQYEIPLRQSSYDALHSRIRRRRIVVTSDYRSIASHSQHHEFWLDGSGFASAVVAHEIKGGSARPWVGVPHPDVEFCALRLADLLVRHALRAGAGGDVILTARLLPAWAQDAVAEVATIPDYTRSQGIVSEGIPLLIDQGSRQPSDDELAHARRDDTEPGQITAPLVDVVTQPRELALAVRRLLIDTLSEDGVAAGQLITESGGLDRLGVLSRRLSETRDWASARGFEFI